ncbi:cell division protein FtsB [Arenicella xantha]|uniref:Cell division protein FtsB n=1 Tax=Arenicella xantha TaxID=644221 RepID=A0A395JKA6_9GAMM|nr:cell division protein FtsB [Arenicella xantha]
MLFLLLIVLQAKLWFGAHGVFQLWSLDSTITDERDRNDLISLRNEALHAEVKELKEGREALEARARSQLGFIKDGEVFYRVIPKVGDALPTE